MNKLFSFGIILKDLSFSKTLIFKRCACEGLRHNKYDYGTVDLVSLISWIRQLDKGQKVFPYDKAK